MNNKKILRVTSDKNGWYKFSKGNIRVQLAGDSRRDGFWLDQYAVKCGIPTFMRDFTIILKAMEKDNAEIFSLYEMPEVIRGELRDI